MTIKGEVPDVAKCGICHLSILYVDDYVRVTEYIKGKEHSQGFYHRECYRRRLQGSPEAKSLQDMAKNMATRVNKLMEDNGI